MIHKSTTHSVRCCCRSVLITENAERREEQKRREWVKGESRAEFAFHYLLLIPILNFIYTKNVKIN
jgi:hypothetical protein